MIRKSSAIVLLFLSLFLFLNQNPIYANCDIAGVIYRDYNYNGIREAQEIGIPNVTITAFWDTPTSDSLATTSQNDGTYLIDLPTTVADNVPLRIEFSLDSLTSSQQRAINPGRLNSGNDTFTSVVFSQGCNGGVHTGGDINFAVVNPTDYCHTTNPLLTTSCYVIGNQVSGPSASRSALISFPSNAGSTAVNVTTPVDPDNYQNPTAHSIDVPANQIGTTWGLTYSRTTDTLLAAAFMKRHAGFGPNGAGAIYRINNANLGTNSGTLFIDMNALTSNVAAGTDTHPSTSPIDANWFYDENSFDAVGKRGLGGIALSEDETILWVIGLNSRILYQVPVSGNPLTPDTTSIVDHTFPTNQTNCPATTDIRPFAVTVRDGLVYIGAVCKQSTWLCLCIRPCRNNIHRSTRYSPKLWT